MPDDDVRHLLNYLFGGPDGLVQARKVDSLPGQEGLYLVERELRLYGVAG